MNTEIVYEYWDAELKDQFKRRLATLRQAIAQTMPIGQPHAIIPLATNRGSTDAGLKLREISSKK